MPLARGHEGRGMKITLIVLFSLYLLGILYFLVTGKGRA
jgi:hypothetical protein